VLATAWLATLAAMYPVILWQGSLLTPNDAGSPVLNATPFALGSRDVEIEDVRQSDYGAMMWGSLPYWKLERDSLAAGEFPLWNRSTAPDACCGDTG
jgi:hypothetical protein